MAASAWAGVAGFDGGHAGGGGGQEPDLGLGEREQGRERGRGRQGTMPSFYHDAGERGDRHRCRGGGHGDGMAMAPVPSTVATGEMMLLRKPPRFISFLFLLLKFENSSP